MYQKNRVVIVDIDNSVERIYNMKVPKYISQAIERRTKSAEVFMHNDWIISKFIDDNHIAVEDYDYHGGCESIVNPTTSAARVYSAIINHKEM